MASSQNASVTLTVALFLALTLTLTLMALPVQADGETESCYSSFYFVPRTNYSTCATLRDNSTLAWSLTYNNSVDENHKYMKGLYVSDATAPGGWVSWGFNLLDHVTEMENSAVLSCYNTADGPKVHQLWLTSTKVSGVAVDNTTEHLNVTSVSCSVQSWSMDGMAMETVYMQFSITLAKKAQYVNVYAKGPTGTTGSMVEGTLIKEHAKKDGRTDAKLRDMRISNTSFPGLIQPLPPPPPPLAPPPPSSPSPPPPSCPRTNSLTPSMTYETCKALTGGSILQWSWNATKSVLSVAFSMTADATSDYIAWGINEDGEAAMDPSSAVICYSRNGVMTGTQYYLAGTSDSDVKVGGKLNLTNLSCGSVSGTGKISMAFDVALDSPKIASIWSTGKVSNADKYIISEHCDACRFATGLTDFSDYTVDIAAEEGPHKKFKNIHGFLAATGWGIVIPLGAMIARYVKPFVGPTWLTIHRVFQTLGYLLGMGGFGMGIKLHYWKERDDRHLALAVAIVVIGSLQVLSSLVKPDIKAKNRIFWNLYHWTGGYAVIALSIINIFIGFHLLQSYGNWRTIYIVIILCLGGLSVLLEIVTWITWLVRKKDHDPELVAPLGGEAPGHSRKSAEQTP